MLLTREEGEQRQLLGLSSRMGRDKRPLVVRRAVERMPFAGGQGRFETWIGGAFDGSHRGKVSGEVFEKGGVVRPKTPIVFQGQREYRIRVREGALFLTLERRGRDPSDVPRFNRRTAHAIREQSGNSDLLSTRET